MKPILIRIFAYPKDIQILSGKGERYSRTCYQRIKKHYQKAPHHLLTIQELAEYYGLTIEELQKILR